MAKTDEYPVSHRDRLTKGAMKKQPTIRFLGTVLFATLVSSSATHAQLGLPKTGLPHRGAIGAGIHPALAGNPKLQAASDPVVVIIKDRKAVPSFGTQGRGSLPRANQRGVTVVVAG
jgi:hypothetical protein